MDLPGLLPWQTHAAAFSLPCENPTKMQVAESLSAQGRAGQGAAWVCAAELRGAFVISPCKGDVSGKQSVCRLLATPEIIAKSSAPSEIYFYEIPAFWGERTIANSLVFAANPSKSTRALQKGLPPPFLIFPLLVEQFLSAVVVCS